jgi:hypothetical protein
MAIRQARLEPLALSASGHERMVYVVIVRLSLRTNQGGIEQANEADFRLAAGPMS